MKKHIKKNKAGSFALIEIIIAVLIISILVVLALPNYVRSVERAKCAQAIHILKSMRSAALSYFNELDHTTMTQNTFTGLTRSNLELQTGGNFFSSDVAANVNTNLNQDWYFKITTHTATRLQLQATRRGGPHTVVVAGSKHDIITLTDDVSTNTHEQWSDPTANGNYPWDNPGDW